MLLVDYRIICVTHIGQILLLGAPLESALCRATSHLIAPQIALILGAPTGAQLSSLSKQIERVTVEVLALKAG